MRLFAAILLSDSMKRALLSLQRKMADRGCRGRFTPEENLHLTLAFIGEYPDAEDVLDVLGGVDFAPFPLTLRGLGCFGDLWWAGMEDSDALEGLVRKIRHALAEAGIPWDRKRFRPHITLVRKAEGPLPGLYVPSVTMEAASFSLMRSDRGRRGMVYAEVGEVPAVRGAFPDPACPPRGR